MLTTAAIIRNAAADCAVEFTQAFSVDKIDVTKWGENRKVCFVDLAVNNSIDKATGERLGLKMTSEFVRRVILAGHTIVAVCDEHDSDLWNEVFEAVGINPSDLLIQPVSQKLCEISSSGGLLMSVLEDADAETLNLCVSADLADHIQFIGIGEIANKTCKANIGDNSRREHLAQHFAFNIQPDEKILGWVKEYEAIESTHQEILANAKLEGNLLFVDSYGKKVDISSLSGLLTKKFPTAKITITHGQGYDKAAGGTVELYIFAVRNDLDMDILTPLQQAGVSATGFGKKASVKPEYYEAALAVVREFVA